MTLRLRALAALLLPFLVASGTAFAYSQLRCRDGSIRERCCCCSKTPSAETGGPVLERSCCEVETVQLDPSPCSESRRLLELCSTVVSSDSPRPWLEPVRPDRRCAERSSLSDCGPPILLRTCTLQV